MTTARTLPEIESELRALVDRWASYAGTEKSGAQTFLNELVAAYTGASTAMEAGASFEHFATRDKGSGFMDLYWPGVAIVEMKAPKESRRLDTHRNQALDYWRNSADPDNDLPAPPYLVLCSFRSFEVWEPGKYPSAPRDTFTLEQLPSRAEALMFLAGGAPTYGGPGAAVTDKATKHMVDAYFRLLDRDAAPPDELRRFTLQAVWALFAEDVGLIPAHTFEGVLRGLQADPTRNSAAEIADLMRRLNTKDDERRNRGRTSPVPYVNGGLFDETPDVALRAPGVADLVAAAAYDWRWVNPTVFGSLMEGCLGHDHRWELGAHYTSEEDILSIVRPVIVRPWLARIEATTEPNDALHLLNEFVQFRILDPAMGCGNFLAIAYREMRALERELHAHVKDLHEAAGLLPPIMPMYPVSNLHGIEIDPFAVDIAKVTLWMTHALVAREFGGANEAPLPLPELDHLVCADSLKTDWPEVDAIIGNPPFHGDRRLRSVVGDDYIDWLKTTFGIGVKDHSVYFFLKAHEHLRAGHRAGLVATNTISQAKNRNASLVAITSDDGVITDAISTKPWSGDAKVHVSIICWGRGLDTSTFVLDGEEVVGITPSLTAGESHRASRKLSANAGIAFQGFLPNGRGYILEDVEATALLNRAEARYSEVIKPFLNGSDIVTRPDSSPSRWIIDFGERALQEAEAFPAAVTVLRERVKPVRDAKNAKGGSNAWWQLWNSRPALRGAMAGLRRIAIGVRTGKRWIAVWGSCDWRPSEATIVFAFDDDYRMGLISSRVHESWARANGSTLKGDLRYGTTTCFMTFPFPTSPAAEQCGRVAAAARRVMDERASVALASGIGLTAMYNALEDGAFPMLREAHADLDLAVLACYGLPSGLLQDEAALLDALFDLNEAAAADPNYAPFAPV